MGNTTWNGKCLFDNNHDDNKYNDAEDGKGSHEGVDDGGESDNDGHNIIRGPSFGGMGHRTIVGPHAATAVIDDNDDNDRHPSWGGLVPPPPPVRPVPPDAARHCRCRQPQSMAAA